MSRVDWSKAPKWATQHGYVSPDLLPVWLNERQYRYVDARQEGRIFSFIAKEGYALEQVMNISSRPKDEWTGEGLPPVGTMVEVVDNGRINIRQESTDFVGKVVRVAATFSMTDSGRKIVCVDGGIDLGCEVFVLELIKPVRTAEQIAAEEREAAIAEIMRASGLRARDGCRDVATEIYDAGYRKQEQK